MISALSLMMKIMVKKENDEGSIDKRIDGLQLDDDDLTEILKDKKFLLYLLQSLADHRGKLSGFNYVKLQPVFTKEFLANYWFHLKKIAQFENVSSVTIDDHEYEEKTVIEFDSIQHSVCEFCESRIHLCLTGFLLNSNKLAKEDEIEERIKFMLVLLFVAFWVADKKDECPNLKEPMARLVHACFSKLFKDLYRGNDDAFKTFIFADYKEQSVLPPLPSSQNCSLNTSALSCVDNIASNVQESKQVEEADPLKEESVKLKYTAKETEDVKEQEDLQTEFDAKLIELRDVTNLYGDLVEEKHCIHYALITVKQALTDSEKQVQSLKAENENIQMKNDSYKTELEEAVSENDRLKETVAERMSELEEVQKRCSDLAEEMKVLEQVLIATKEKLSHSNSIIAEKEDEIKYLNGQIQFLNENVDELAVELDSSKNEFSKVVAENAHVKDTVKEIEDENKNILEKLQSLNENVDRLQIERDSYKTQLEEAVSEKNCLKNAVDARMLELEDVQKRCSDLAEENNVLKQDLMGAKEKLLHSNSIIVEKEDENKNILCQIQSLSETVDELQMELDSCKNELSKVVVENARLKDTVKEIENEKEVLQIKLDVNDNELLNGTIMNKLEPFDDEKGDKSDSVDNYEIEQTPQIMATDIKTSTRKQNIFSRRTSSSNSNFLFFFLSLLLFFTVWIYFFGACIPSWVYIQVHHDHLPPQ